MTEIRLAYTNDKMPPRMKPSSSDNSPQTSPPRQTDSLHSLLERLITLQPSMRDVLEKRFAIMVASAERIARDRTLFMIIGFFVTL